MAKYRPYDEGSPYNSGINDLPKVLKNVLEEIEKKLGWVGTIVVGGPSPDTGKLMAMM